MERNNISKIPDDIDKLENLQRLILAQNELTDIPSRLFNIKSLIVLWLGANKIESLPIEITNMEPAPYGTILRYCRDEIMDTLACISVSGNHLCSVQPEVTKWLDEQLSNTSSWDWKQRQFCSEPITPTKTEYVGNVNQKLLLTVFPNPFNAITNITLPEHKMAFVSICDISGKIDS